MTTRTARRIYETIIPAGSLLLSSSIAAEKNGTPLHFNSFRYENILLVSAVRPTIARGGGVPLSLAVDMAKGIAGRLGDTPLTRMLNESLGRIPDGAESYELSLPEGNVLFFVNASRSFGEHEQAASASFRIALTDAERSGITITERWLPAETVEGLFSDASAPLADAEERDADAVSEDAMQHGMGLLKALTSGAQETTRLNAFFAIDEEQEQAKVDDSGVPVIMSEGNQRHAPVPLWVLGHMKDGGGRCFHTKVASMTAPMLTVLDKPDENGCTRKWTFPDRVIEVLPSDKDDYIKFAVLSEHTLGGRTDDVFMEPAGTALYPEDVYRSLFDGEAPEPEKWYDESEVRQYNQFHIVMPGDVPATKN